MITAGSSESALPGSAFGPRSLMPTPLALILPSFTSQTIGSASRETLPQPLIPRFMQTNTKSLHCTVPGRRLPGGRNAGNPGRMRCLAAPMNSRKPRQAAATLIQSRLAEAPITDGTRAYPSAWKATTCAPVFLVSRRTTSSSAAESFSTFKRRRARGPREISVEPCRRRRFVRRAGPGRRKGRRSDFPGAGPCTARRYPRASAASRKGLRNRLRRHCREMGRASR